MKSIYIAIIAVIAIAVFATNAKATVPAAVSGYIYNTNNAGVSGATVDVTCDHSNVNTTLQTISDVDGSYLQIFDSDKCAFGDLVSVNAQKGNLAGSNDGAVCTAQDCSFPVALVDVTVPEFGVLAGAIALIGTIAVLVFMRRQ